jgi:HSP20 family protein
LIPVSRFDFAGKHNPLGEFFRFLEDVADRGRRILLGPAIDVYETETEVVVEVDVPGWHKDELSLQIVDDQLHISGQRKAPAAENRSYLRRERYLDQLEETIRLPFDVPAENIRANLSNGVLTVVLPKPGPRPPGTSINIE